MNDDKENTSKKIIDTLGAAGISMAYIERSLQLPKRTLTRWKSGNCSASSLALLKFIETFPWLLEVANTGFKTDDANCTLVKYASNALKQVIEAQK